MSSFKTAMREKYTFFANSFKSFDTSAAILPSSKTLVKDMLDPVPLDTTKVVVEFGPGTGTLTREILKRLNPKGKLYAIELDPALHKAMVDSIKDDRFIPICGDAAHVVEILKKDGIDKADAIISSLGNSMIPGAIRDSIWDAAVKAVKADGIVTQYAYVHARYLVLSRAVKVPLQFNAHRYFARYFGAQKSHVVWANVPPAHVLTLTGPKVPPAA